MPQIYYALFSESGCILYAKALNRVLFMVYTRFFTVNIRHWEPPKITIAITILTPRTITIIYLIIIFLAVSNSHPPASGGAQHFLPSPAKWVLHIHNHKTFKIESPLLSQNIGERRITYQFLDKLPFLLLLNVGHQFCLSDKSLLESLHHYKHSCVGLFLSREPFFLIA